MKNNDDLGKVSYKGYSGTIKYSEVDNVLHCKIEGIKDHVSCEGGFLETLLQSFIDSVDDYLDICNFIGKKPYKPKKSKKHRN